MNDYERVAAVIRHLDEHHTAQPALDELAAAAGLSISHFHRLFRRWAGVTPKDFLQCLTAEHAKRRLRESASVLEATLDAGLSGPGRLHDLLVTIEAASPGEFKSGGEGMSIEWGEADSPFGSCSIGWNSRGICHIDFDESGKSAAVPTALRANWPNARFRRNDREARRVAKMIFNVAETLASKAAPSSQPSTVKRVVDGTTALTPALSPRRGGSIVNRGIFTPDGVFANMMAPRVGEKGPEGVRAFVRGTPFQLKVWRALLRVPEGGVVSYGTIAGSIGEPQAARAVGSACGANAIAYLIPCHRVIRETGVVNGYRWGDARKRVMLAREFGAGRLYEETRKLGRQEFR